MKTPTKKLPELAPSGTSPEATGAPPSHFAGRQKSSLPTNRRQALVVVEGLEEKVRPGPWKTRIALSLLAAAVLWFLIQSVLFRLVDTYYVPVSTANIVSGVIVDGPKASPPFASLLGTIQGIAAGEPGADPLAFPLTWVAAMALIYGLMLLTDRRQTGLASKVLDEVPLGIKAEQEKFFGGAAGGLQSPLEIKEDVDGDHFADDLPSHIRKTLHWWNDAESPESAVLLNSVGELKAFLGEEAYYWLRACSVWPEPQWHLVLFLGRGLRNSHGESLHSFETADRLASLPWFMVGKMPLWLRRYFLGTLTKEQQQEIRYLIQGLLISTARGTKTDFALELVEYHTLFMKTAGNETTSAILKDLPSGSLLREDLLTQFMSKPLDSSFYKGLKNRDQSGGDDSGAGTGLARISAAAQWISRLLWGASGVAAIATVVLLIVLGNMGGVMVSTRHGQGTVEFNDVKKSQPATFFWMPAGHNEIVVTSKDFEPARIKVNIKGRTIVNLGPVVLKHLRTGFEHPQPGDPKE